MSSSTVSSTPSPRVNEGRRVQRSIRHFFSSPSPNSPSTKPKTEAATESASVAEQKASFPALEVVWAKFSSYPPWPALVLPAEPAEGKRGGGGDVHVQFFDEQSSHAWVETGAVEKFRGAAADSAMTASVKKKGRWTKALTRAIKEAEVAEGMKAAKRKELLVDHQNDQEDGGHDVDDGYDEEEERRPKKRRNNRSSAAKSSKGKKDRDSETKENECDEENNIISYHDDPEEMSEYEKIRQKNIEERQRKFQELQLNEAKTRLSDSLNLAPAAKKARANTSYRGLAVKKEKAEQSNEPVRKSLRLQNIEAETGLKLPEKEPTLLHWTPPDEHPTLPFRTLALGEVTKNDEGGEEDTAPKAVVDFLKGVSGLEVAETKKIAFGDDVSASLKKLSITDDGVAKVVPDRIFSLAVHPTETKVLVGVGGKWGGLGLWDVSNDAESENHGVHLFTPHSRPVNCLTFDAYNHNHLVSTSYDGSVRLFDIEQQKFDLLYGTEDGYTTFHRQLDAHCYLVTMGSSGVVGLVDTREQDKMRCSKSFQAFAKGAKTVDIHPLKRDLFMSHSNSNGGTCAIFDMRTGGGSSKSPMKPILELGGHTKAVSSATFSPVTGKSVVTVAYDNKLRLFKSFSPAEKSIRPYKTVAHNTQTGRWLTTFKAEWHPRRDDLFFVGVMAHPRQVTAFTDQGVALPTLSGEALGSVCSIVKAHPTADVVVGGNSSGRVFVFK